MECELCRKFREKYPPVINPEIGSIHQINDHCSMSEINCYFDGKKQNNWNCQTLNAIRDLYDFDKPSKNMLYYYREDQNTLFIDISQIFDCEDELYQNWLYVTWYKSCGTVDNILMLFEYSPARKPTENELIEILRYYKGAKDEIFKS